MWRIHSIGLDLLQFILLFILHAPAFTILQWADASRMKPNGAERERNLNLWCLLLLPLSLYLSFFSLPEKLHLSQFFSAIIYPLLQIAKKIKNSPFFFLPVDQVQESISPQSEGGGCLSKHVSLLSWKTFQYSVLNVAWSVKWFHEARA